VPFELTARSFFSLARSRDHTPAGAVPARSRAVYSELTAGVPVLPVLCQLLTRL